MAAPAQGHGEQLLGVWPMSPNLHASGGSSRADAWGQCHPHFTDKGTFLTPQGLEPDRLVVICLGCSTPWSLGQERGSLLV